jgi:type IV secretion system protein VirB2
MKGRLTHAANRLCYPIYGGANSANVALSSLAMSLTPAIANAQTVSGGASPATMVNNICTFILGPFGQSLAVLGIIGIGLAWMFGRASLSGVIGGIIIMFGASCAPQSALISSDTSAMRVRKMAISQQFQKDWERCIDASYRVIQEKTADKNAAAEQAFSSCATEEDQMNSLYDPAINAMVMPHFKAEAKHLLIESGHISTSP